MSLHAPKGKESGTTKIPCLKSHIQIHLPADRSWCAGQIQLWFVRCPFGLSNLTGKHGLQEGDQLANFIVANYRNSFVYEQIGISSLNPSSSSVASHDCVCQNRQLEVVVAQIDGVHKLHTQKDFCRGVCVGHLKVVQNHVGGKNLWSPIGSR